MQCLGYSYLDDPVRKPRKPRTRRSAHAAEETLSLSGQTNQPVEVSISASLNEISSHAGSSSLCGNRTGLEHQNLDDTPPISFEPVVASYSMNSADTHLASLRPSYSGKSEKLIEPTFPPTSGPDLLAQPHFVGGMLDDPSIRGSGPPSSANCSWSSNMASQPPGLTTDDAKIPIVKQAPSYQTLSRARAMGYNYIPRRIEDNSAIFPKSESRNEPNAAAESESESEDMEGVMEAIRRELPLDRDVTSNSLPYILASCAFPHGIYIDLLIGVIDFHSMMRNLFEPTPRVYIARDFLIRRCTASDDLRCTSMLLATVADFVDRSPRMSVGKFPALNMLVHRLCDQLALAKSGLESQPEKYRDDALMVLSHIYEVGNSLLA
ncbi:Fungal specific transcription factor domain [Ceratobasidium sp. AG-Ba]|nr:Fungal specific transcription factor domain [Ceratobasidium sp. AG-Ba]QRW07189.1 Fungal specific transcription factor domain [Ceratobasidium sp. AG-Ba]